MRIRDPAPYDGRRIKFFLKARAVTTMHTDTPFDILHTDLEETNLIEASAGTGKTYTLTGLFLRLLVEQSLHVDRILVVTFTEAATAELKERIRKRLRNAVDAFSGEAVQDSFLEGLAAKTGRTAGTLRRLRQALRDFDRAAIFTIHGFCRRVLEEHAFESAMPFETDLLPDQKALEQSVVEDFWRKQVSQASPLFASYALAQGFEPSRLLNLVKSVTGLLKPRILPRKEIPNTTSLETEYRRAFDRLVEAWPGARNAVSSILLEDKALNRSRYRPDAVNRWLRSMDRCALPGGADPLLFEGFERFTSSYIKKSTRKKQAPPDHPFFALCDSLFNLRESLIEAFDRRLLGLKAALFDEIEAELPKRKAARNVQSFDDLLRGLFKALQGASGERLATTLSSRYEAALIDEFQDTDPVQYGIFRRIFSRAKAPLFLIGDPKQAIYGFRGADVFAYMDAAREAAHKHTLPKNYRSEPGLVKAVNTLFRNQENPFVFRDIPFHEVAPAGEEKHIPALRIRDRNEAAFHIWIAGSEEFSSSSGRITKETGRRHIPEAVASEIARLVAAGRSGEAVINGSPVREGDMAVLLRTNKEARLVQNSLSVRRIPTVLYTTSSLFETDEAVEVGRILAAMARPEHEGRVRAALATTSLGWNGAALDALSSNDKAREERLLRFRSHHESWREKGFLCAFRGLLRRESVLPRVLALPDGERRATNLLHLSEVLHQAERERRLGLEGLVQWLYEQIDPRTRGTEEQPLRLESDRNAVKLVTIHKSKGLEYPIVFCPFIWEASVVRDRKGPVAYHDPHHGGRLTLDLGSSPPERDDHIALAEQEMLSENLRLLYVAFTRARHRCYTVWGRFNRADTSAPAYLFHARPPQAGHPPLEASALDYAGLEDADMRADLEALAAASGGTIRPASLPRGDRVLSPERPVSPPDLSAKTFKGRIDRSWGIASFSSLTTSHPHGVDIEEHDTVLEPMEGIEQEPLEPAADEDPAGLCGFPGGTRSGLCLHAILETLDFRDPDPHTLSEAVQTALRAYGFDPAWEPSVCDMIRAVISTPLDSNRHRLRLERVSMENRLNELSFFFPLRSVSPEDLQGILLPHAGCGVPKPLPEHIGRLRFSPVQGFMRGFVDLVFRFEGRFYIVDWKSNDLGPSMKDYRPDRIEAAMSGGLYHLQYLLYTLAVDRYLSLRLPEYEYGAHFGGVFYVFLRGVSPAHGPGSGVFPNIPPEPLIRALRENLSP